MGSSSSSYEESVFFDSGLKIWYIYQRTQKIKVHQLNKRRKYFGEYHHLYKDLTLDSDRFFGYMRMNVSTFDYIVSKIDTKLDKNWKNFHSQPIVAEERLMLTIRYLSTGASFRSLSYSFRMGHSTVRNIILEVVGLLWDVLHETHMPIPSQSDFEKIANDYYNIWNFPNCAGSLDGKHVRVRCPSHSGSMFFNYKGFFSIVLQALVDAHYRFINIDVGGYGKQSDGGTFKASPLYKKMIDGNLNLPENRALPNSDLLMPYVILADEAYPLMKNLLKPYNRADLSADREYFNKCLSRARRTVECTFGIIRSKWEILDRPILTEPHFADKIIKAICVLYSTIIDKEGIEHHLKRLELQFKHPQEQRRQAPAGRLNLEAKDVRDTFKTYLCRNPIY